jgi:hypothetical protein
MPNMSYCRFENTLIDLRDCLAVLREEGLDGIESRSELECAQSLAIVARKIVKAYEEAVGREEAKKLGLDYDE